MIYWLCWRGPSIRHKEPIHSLLKLSCELGNLSLFKNLLFCLEFEGRSLDARVEVQTLFAGKEQRCTGSELQDSSPAGFSTFWTNRIGFGLRFYSSFRIRIWIGIFKFHFFGFWCQNNHKKIWQRFIGCNVVYIMLCFSLTELQNSEHLVQNALYFIRRR